MRDMKMSPQQERVYRYLKEHPSSTTAEIDNALCIRRTSMRISEINFAHRKEHGEDLIVNCGKTRSGEVKKMIRRPLTRVVEEPRFNANGEVTMVPVVRAV